MGWCPVCGAEYGPEIVACPRCRASLEDERPPSGIVEPAVAYRVPDAAAGAMLVGMLEHNGIRAMLRSTTLPALGMVRRDWSTSTWGEILVRGSDLEDARELIVEYLELLERGGRVRDEDVEGEAPG